MELGAIKIVIFEILRHQQTYAFLRRLRSASGPQDRVGLIYAVRMTFMACGYFGASQIWIDIQEILAKISFFSPKKQI